MVDNDKQDMTATDDISHLISTVVLRLKRQYHKSAARMFAVASVLSVIFAASAVSVDVFLPFGGWWTLLRTFLLIPLSMSLFVLGYTVALFLFYAQAEQAKVDHEEEYVSFRGRMSAAWRRRIAAIVAAVGILITYANGHSATYTFVSSCFVAVLLGLVLFIRLTAEESKLADAGIPDPRDLAYRVESAKIKSTLKKRSERKKEIRKAKIKARITGIDDTENEPSDS